MWESKKKYCIDRFIPRRAGENFNISNYCLTNSGIAMNDIAPMSTPKYVNYAAQFFARKTYVEKLWKLLEPMPRRILNFTEANSIESEPTEDQPWPVVSRKRPLIVSPLVILDMPELDTHLCHNIIDWGKRGHIASLYNGEMHIWHPSQPKTTQTHTDQRVQFCVKWDRAGTRLALAVDNSTILIVEAETTEILFKRVCCKSKGCIITSMTWTKDDILMSGCTNGNLTSWFLLSGVGRSVCRAHKGAIIGIKFSCYEQYLASSGLDNFIRIWSWPELIYTFEICYYLPVKAFAWHPWREPLLMCSGGKRNNMVALWNISSFKDVTWYISDNYTFVDSMTFNKTTGELVVSFYDSTTEKSLIAVFSNFNGISDGIIWHLGRVPYLLWNGDNTKLLTAGSDENLCIWDFFGKDKKISKKKKKLSTNPLRNLNCFRQYIR